jgi:hypothetical protein
VAVAYRLHHGAERRTKSDRVQASGAVGNFMEESGLDPASIETPGDTPVVELISP